MIPATFPGFNLTTFTFIRHFTVYFLVRLLIMALDYISHPAELVKGGVLLIC